MAFLPDLADRLADAAARYRVPGAAVSVWRDGDSTEAVTGVLNLDTGVAATADSLFLIGSVSKVYTAALVLQLVDEGTVDLDADVRTYLPGFALPGERSVTVRQLLCHTGGFAGDLFTDTGRGDDALDRYVAQLSTAAAPVHPPGAMFSYCNAGYSVLGALVARLHGNPWEAVLRDRLLGPLDAHHTVTFAEEAVRFRVAMGHVKPPGADAYRPAPRWQLPRSTVPAGGVCATPADLVRFGREFLPGGATVLSRDVVAAMRTPQVSVPGVNVRLGSHWGLGLALFDWDGTPVLGHDGKACGQFTTWRVLPEHGLVVVVTANGGDAIGFKHELLTAVVGEASGVAVPPAPVPPARPGPPPDGYTGGRYVTPAFEGRVSIVDGVLHITWIPADDPDATERYRLVPLVGDTLVTLERDSGVHDTVTLLDGGRYLHASGRAVPRV